MVVDVTFPGLLALAIPAYGILLVIERKLERVVTTIELCPNCPHGATMKHKIKEK